MKLPVPVPELPVNDIDSAGAFYQQRMGFNIDWKYEDYLSGISRDDARIFLRQRTVEERKQNYSVLVWLNLHSTQEVDELYAQWKRDGVPIVDELETKPWNLREFTDQEPPWPDSAKLARPRFFAFFRGRSCKLSHRLK